VPGCARVEKRASKPIEKWDSQDFLSGIAHALWWADEDDLRSNPGETPTVRKTSIFFMTLCLAIATASFAATTPPAPAKPAPTKTTTTTKTTKTHHHHHHQKPAPAKKG
jgi:hypothetical protein